MQQVIFTSKFYCELCNKESPIRLYGSSDSIFSTDEEPELIEWARHYHWIDHHRICAICGNIVLTGDLDLTINNGQINICGGYTDHYRKIRPGQRMNSLLIIHEKCTQEYGKQTKDQ